MKHQSHVLSSLFFLLCTSLSFSSYSAIAQNASFDVGVILNLETWSGKMSMSCISMALSDFYATHNYNTTLVLHTRDAKEDVVDAASAALDLLNNVKVQAIIGPQSSAQATFMVDLGKKALVPIISSSATSPSLSPIRTPYFIRTALNDSIQTKAIASIVQAFGWKEVIPIYEDTEYGSGIIPYLTDALQEVDTRIPFRSVISISATEEEILSELYKLALMQTRVFVVHLSSTLASCFFAKVKEAGLMSEGWAWIVTDGIMNFLDSMDSSIINSMQGVLGVKPYVPKSKILEDFTVRWKRKFRQENPNNERVELSVSGLWAYDTVQAVAMAAERVGVADSYCTPKTGEKSTELATLRTGPRLREEILKTQFKGLNGKFRLVDGQLESPAFQIVNVIGKGEREIGFWTPGYGISQVLNSSGQKMHSTSRVDLGVIIWPGEVTVVPKGWVIPTVGKKLRIGVPVKVGFQEFVKVERDARTNETIVTGYAIDVFSAVMEALPYAVPYDLVPFANADGQSAGSYDDLVYQVYLQKYDAVAGDAIIRANRSQYVDFTLPYSESGIAMVVPSIGDDKKNAWIFLKPLTRDLWLATGFAFTFIGFVVWVLEHRINDDFRGASYSQQVGLVFWFSFSTLVFAHKEKIVNNYSRFVLIIWLFVVLILTSSYTASLASMLTVQQLKPTVTDVADLIRNGDYVGYHKGSFMLGLLKQMKFKESKLRGFTTPEEYDEALSKGSRNGGVAAIFNEIPYLKLFLSKYCNKYSLVGPIFKTAGFGFVFPKGSPLVPDVSRAILKVTEGDKILEIQHKWFGHERTCPDQSATLNSNSLTLNSFRGLFIIAGVASTSALSIHLALFLYNSKGVFTNLDNNHSIWQKMVEIFKRFDQKDCPTRDSENDKPEVRGGETLPTVSVSYSPTTESGPSIHGSDVDSISEENVPSFFWNYNTESDR
ncbi:glutamate receptor 2.8-like [Tasmannia lanceolata]|uniref:glutamate receptor 2.8-like n=1 Tax=Tasmannia lanceolata TaxID=3420 RepID=UPI0040635CF6